MKRIFQGSILFLFTIGLLQLQAVDVNAQPGGSAKPKAAIFMNDLTGKQPVSATDSELAALIAWLRVVPRATNEQKLRSANIKVGPEIDPPTAVKIGKLLGVNYLIVNNTTSADSQRSGAWNGLTVNVSTSLIDTSTGEIVWIFSSTQTGRTKGAIDLAEMLGVMASACARANAASIGALKPKSR